MPHDFFEDVAGFVVFGGDDFEVDRAAGLIFDSVGWSASNGNSFLQKCMYHLRSGWVAPGKSLVYRCMSAGMCITIYGGERIHFENQGFSRMFLLNSAPQLHLAQLCRIHAY